ncbi:circadian clock protein KaiA [Leptolyngbya sp. BC1307]|uniref:circadian clock protein KaiA n=1 Tax=Leptolyngbya sp. BC1307 TaxID=2029589 RepID=UPI000EFBD1E8|nr:circadian clock protein KaiA [Leptolyngbya sp. BC1307]
MSAQFLIGVFVPTESLADLLRQLLAQKSFVVSWSQSATDFTDWVISNRHRIDCLIVQSSEAAFQALRELKRRDILLPALTVDHPTGFDRSEDSTGPISGPEAALEGSSRAAADEAIAESVSQRVFSYHEAVAALDIDDLDGVDEAIRLAVKRYLQLPTDETKAQAAKQPESATDERDKRLFLLSLQQQRLTEKLQERLGYAGVYYKRNQRNFLRHMSASEHHEFLDKLRQDYRHIILNYFADDGTVNQKIDDFVNVAFFADMSVPKIVEIHMELIDDFSKQLQLEGRNEEILADYRLTLIDVVAHLCEMYRRSIPRGM